MLHKSFASTIAVAAIAALFVSTLSAEATVYGTPAVTELSGLRSINDGLGTGSNTFPDSTISWTVRRDDDQWVYTYAIDARSNETEILAIAIDLNDSVTMIGDTLPALEVRSITGGPTNLTATTTFGDVPIPATGGIEGAVDVRRPTGSFGRFIQLEVTVRSRFAPVYGHFAYGDPALAPSTFEMTANDGLSDPTSDDPTDFVVVPGGPAPIHVDESVPGGTSGTTWEDAFPTLQQALALAGPGDEIWVASGTYFPDEDGSTDSGNRNAAFQMAPGVAVYGGFAGGELSREERDPEGNPTILSGDLGQDDNGGLVGNNAFHVVLALGADESTTLDGFVVTGGTGFYGSGLICSADSRLVVRDCVFTGNVSADVDGDPLLDELPIGDSGFPAGGCILCIQNDTRTEPIGDEGGPPDGLGDALDGGPSFVRCEISGNSIAGEVPSLGATIVFEATTATMNECRITGNEAAAGPGIGGFLISGDSTVAITNSQISGNIGSVAGGGLIVEGGGGFLAGNLITGNLGSVGGVFALAADYAVLVNCTVTGNAGGEDDEFFAVAGGVGAEDCSLEIINCIIWNNLAFGLTEIPPASISGGGAGAPVLITASLIENIEPWDDFSDVGNLFVSPVPPGAAPTTAGDYRPGDDSSPIDAGDFGSETFEYLRVLLGGDQPAAGEGELPPAFDIAASPRVLGRTVDIGAYEFLDHYYHWALPYFPRIVDPDVIGFSADPNMDGVSNGLSFVTATSPVVPSPAADGVASTGEGTIVFEFRRNPDAEYLNPDIEISFDLETWLSTSNEIPGVDVSAEEMFGFVEYTVEVDQDLRGFVRQVYDAPAPGGP
ncbi:MAG: right-handed parallel beta-helix repeat-containing protein [Verrucomicrobiales bacterium]